jgi:RNA-directed DNA polymerase
MGNTLYRERWLKTPMQLPDGSLQEKTQGVMQGGVISPVLSNLFLHYVFDAWMKKNHPEILWCRYADDALAHCETEQQAQELLSALKLRFKECGLELHPEKTKIVYCRDENRKGMYPKTDFVFLGYNFRGRKVKKQEKDVFFIGFTPAVSEQALKSMRAETRRRGFRNRTDMSLNEIAHEFNPVLRGWMNYYGRYNRSSMYPVLRHFNKTLVAWAMRKFKKLRGRKTRATKFLEKIAEREPQLFIHWKEGMRGAFA